MNQADEMAFVDRREFTPEDLASLRSAVATMLFNQPGAIHPITSYQLDRETGDYERVTLYVAVSGSECSTAYEFPCLALAWAYVEGWL